MSFFSARKPSGFNHRFIYIDERKERLEQLERRAREELGQPTGSERRMEHLHGTFRQDSLKRRRMAQNRLMVFYLACLVIILLALMGLTFLF